MLSVHRLPELISKFKDHAEQDLPEYQFDAHCHLLFQQTGAKTQQVPG
jgi:hypothetical protein